MARTASSIRRKLAAIIAADVAGYSRLMSLDESGTFLALSQARNVFDQLISEYDGRIANTAEIAFSQSFRVRSTLWSAALRFRTRLRKQRQSYLKTLR